MKRVEVEEYPVRAIREALVNAIIHRDYQIVGSEIHVDMYDDRLEITSPGGMLDRSFIQNLDITKVASMRRNRIISDIFNRLHFMEWRGSGLTRILESYNGYDIKPSFLSDASFFKVTFPNKGYIQGKHLELVGSSYVNGNVVTDNDYFVIKMYRNLPHNVTKNTYDKIQKLFDKYTYEYEFDREDVEELLNQEAIFEAGKTVNEALVGKIATIGENLSIRRFARFESKGLLESYIHGDGKIAVLINMTKGEKELAKDLCMQIAAARPEYLNEQSVPAERVEKEKEILKVQTMNEGKPEQIAEKIVQGRIRKFFEEICLVDQVFVKDSNMKVSELLKQKDAEIAEFARFEKGEGIEKKEENFAEEVMNQLK